MEGVYNWEDEWDMPDDDNLEIMFIMLEKGANYPEHPSWFNLAEAAVRNGFQDVDEYDPGLG